MIFLFQGCILRFQGCTQVLARNFPCEACYSQFQVEKVCELKQNGMNFFPFTNLWDDVMYLNMPPTWKTFEKRSVLVPGRNGKGNGSQKTGGPWQPSLRHVHFSVGNWWIWGAEVGLENMQCLGLSSHLGILPSYLSKYFFCFASSQLFSECFHNEGWRATITN